MEPLRGRHLTRPRPDPRKGCLAMNQKGRPQAGADAAITIFDPETAIDRATYENPRLT
jgi:hypothetical protein